MQNITEIKRIFTEWGENFAPKGLLLNERNANLLFDYLKDEGFISVSNLTAAAQVLKPQLDWAPEKSASQIALEKAAEGDKKMREDYFNSVRQQDTQKIVANKADEAKKLAIAKEIASLKGQIDSVINNYVAGHYSGATNWAKTEAGQETMRKVLAKYNLATVESAKLALEAVRSAKAKLP